MSTSDLGNVRGEAQRNRAENRSFGRGMLIGITAGAVIAMICAVVLNPAFSDWLNRRAADAAGNDASRERSGAEKDDDNADRVASRGDENDQEEGGGQMRLVGRQGAGDQDAADDQNASTAVTSIGELKQAFASFQDDIEKRLSAVETAAAGGAADASDELASGADGAFEDFKTQLLARLDELDAKLLTYDQMADDYTALRKSVEDFPKTEMRQSRDELDHDGQTTVRRPTNLGTLVLNNTTGVEGYVYVNDKPVWLKLGQNEIKTELGDVEVRIPNGGKSYSIDAAFWERDADGAYVMNRSSWPP